VIPRSTHQNCENCALVWARTQFRRFQRLQN